LYHCRYPMLALDKLSAVCQDEIYIESAISTDYSPYTVDIGKGHGENMVMEFFPGEEFGGVGSNWWSPTLKCLCAMVAAAGWNDVRYWKYDAPTQVCLCRGFARGKK